ncbi:ThiF family adenylyltransferase, partial [Staphylococcus aureus]|nr:ThiF family adenylyltransferase [Staphylococcus aureus]
DGTDNFESRYVIARACADLKKPHLYAGLFRFEGQLALFEPCGACYACLFPAPPKQEDVPNCSEAGVLGPLAGAMGALQA